MRLITSNPAPYSPRSETERILCEKVALDSGEPVIELRMRLDDEFDGDYELRTGTLTNDLICSGSVYLGFVSAEGSISIEWDGSWNA